MADEEIPPMMKLLQINKALEQELAAWDRDQLPFGQFGVNTINLDNQLWGLVEYIKTLIPEFDDYEYEYRWKSRMLGKIHELRMQVKAQQSMQDITQGIIGPDGSPIKVPKNNG